MPNIIKNLVAGIKKTPQIIEDLLSSDPIIYNAPPEPTKQPEKAKYDTDKLLESFRYLESRGEKDPYGFSQPSGREELGDALGAYQITEAKLKEQSKKLGFERPITKEEFLKDPALQDDFMRRMIGRFTDEFGFDLPTIFAAHRGGFSNLDQMATVYNNYKSYADEGVNKYNEFTNANN